jgi:hypothetical protein
VQASIDRCNVTAGLLHRIGHSAVNRQELGLRNNSPPDHRLIGNNYHTLAYLPQGADGIKRTWEKLKL